MSDDKRPDEKSTEQIADGISRPPRNLDGIIHDIGHIDFLERREKRLP